MIASLGNLISVRDGLSDISFFSDGISMFVYDDVCDLISHFALSYYFICTFFLHNVRIVRSFIINK